MSASGMESEGEVYKVTARTEMLAIDVGARAAKAAKDYLSPFVGPEADQLTVEQVVRIVEAKRKEAMDAFKAEREAGKHNDKKSVAAGLVALLRTSQQDVEQRVKMRLLAEQLSSPRLTDASIDGSPLLQMELPTGIFIADFESTRQKRIVFYLEGDFADQVLVRTAGRFSLHDFDVIRIVGSEGELWQNPSYTATGTPLPPEPMDFPPLPEQ